MTKTATLSSKTCSGLLDDYLSLDQLAAEIGKTTRTLRSWDKEKRGPPVTLIGRSPFYHRSSVLKWLRNQERVNKQPTT